nr:hypothetical protein [Tanacetum cinerariifolium]
MADKEKKSTMKGFATNDQWDYYSGITSIIVNGKIAYELKGTFLDDLHKNAFSGFNTYDEYKDDWIYEWKKMCHGYMKNYGLMLDWREDGYCNRGNLPGACIVGNTLRYQDLEWYDALKDSELKEEALRNKDIMEILINEDVESNDEGWKSWEDFENTNGDHNEWEYKNEHEDNERHELCGN